MYGDDKWYQCNKWNGDIEIMMQKMTHEIGNEDREVVRYETHAYYLKDGKYEPSAAMYRPVYKRMISGNSVTNCQKAIEKYLKAKDEAKMSVGVMIEYLNVKS